MRVPSRVYSRSVLFVLAACGSDDPALPDGPPGPDAMVDAVIPATTITVRVDQEESEPIPGAPIEGTPIAVVPPGSITAAVTMTDASGMAVVPFAAGSTLWVARFGEFTPAVAAAGGVQGYVYLLLDVAPGDTVVLGAPARLAASQAGTLTVSFTPMLGAVSYRFDGDDYYKRLSPCVDVGFMAVPGQIEYQVTTGCAAPARDLVVTAFDLNGAVSGWLRIPNVPANAAAIDGTAAAWETAGADYTTTVANLPVDAADVYTDAIAASSWHRAANVVSGPSGSNTVTDIALTGPGLVVSEIDSFARSRQWVIEPVTSVAATITVDGAGILPLLSRATFDAPTRVISWTESLTTVAPTAPQLITSSFSFFDDVDGTVRRWTIYAAGSRTALAIPDVPDAITTHDLQGSSTPFPDLWYLNVAGSSYSSLLSDVDLARGAILDENLGDFDYRVTTRVLLSGGDGPDIKLKP